MKTSHTLDEFIQQHDGRIEHGSAQTEGDAKKIPRAVAGSSCDQHETCGCHGKAEDLFSAELFLEDEGTNDHYDHGRKIIAEGRNGDGGVFISFEQENPVDAHGCAGEQQEQ